MGVLQIVMDFSCRIETILRNPLRGISYEGPESYEFPGSLFNLWCVLLGC